MTFAFLNGLLQPRLVRLLTGCVYNYGRYTMTSMNVPEPVMSLAIMPKARDASGNFSKALTRFQREDPTFRVRDMLTFPILL